MFRIKSDNYEIYNLKNEKKYIVESPKLTQELNKSGDLSFYLPPTHPNYERITGLTSRIQLYNNNVLEFAGRTIENKDSFYKKRYIKVEGELSYLCDSIQRLAVYRCTPLQFFTQIIQNHNSQVEEAKRFNVGMFTISDANNYIYRYTNYEDTLTVLNEKLIKSLGGFLRVRYANGNRYLDLLEDYGKTNSQVIRFGKNILDLDKYIKFSSIKTAMIPLGTETDETVSTQDETGTIKKRLTITDYPDGEYGDIVKSGDMIYSKSGVQNYGYIFASKEDSTFKDVTLAENLYSKSVSKLNSLLNSSLTIELNAIDLNLINVDIEKIELGDRIKVLSPPHNLNEYFVVSKIVKDLSNPKNNKITLGNTIKKLTSSINSRNTVINSNINELAGSSTNALNEAKQNATDILNSVQGGYVKLIDGELYILDNENLNQAQKIWRWNLNGLGYTQNGKNGTYGLAMTMDGQIVADYITTGTLRSLQIINGDNFSVDQSGKMIAKSGTIAGLTMSSTNNNSYLFKNYTDNNNNNLQSGLYIPASTNGSAPFIYAGAPVGGYLTDSNFLIRHDGLIKAKWFEMNGESGYFHISYDSGKTALNFDKDGIRWRLDNSNNNNFALLWKASTGMYLELYDSPKFTVRDAVHNYKEIIDIVKYNPSASAYYENVGDSIVVTADLRVVGYRYDGVNYTMRIQGYEVATNASDERLKENIKDSNESALAKLDKIKIRSFDWRKDKHLSQGGKHINNGYIAQEVIKVDDTLVNYNKDEDTYQMEVLNISALHTKAIQELYKDIQEIKDFMKGEQE